MCKVYGYCRVSTPTQNIERQVRNISAVYPDAIIVRETYTGRKIEGRRAFERILKVIKSGDTIVFDSVSRMSRSAEEGVALYEDLYNKGVELVFLNEPTVSTAVYRAALAEAVPMTGTDVDMILSGVNKYLMTLAKRQVKAAFEQAQKEVDDLSKRTKGGIETARLMGKQIGQATGKTLTVKKAAPAKDLIKKHHREFDGQLNDTEMMKLAGISRNTLKKYKSELYAAENT